MKTVIPITALLISLSAVATERELSCKVELNSETMLVKEISLREGDQQKLLGSVENFKFFLSASKPTVQLEVFDGNGPARHYSTATLSSAHSYLELASWKREYLLEVRCSLIK